MNEPRTKTKTLGVKVTLLSVVGLLLFGIGLTIAWYVMNDEIAKTQKNVNSTAIENQHVIIDNTLDNGKSTVYIKADKARDFSNEYVHPYVKELILKKEQWQTKNPFKEIVAMTMLSKSGTHGTSELGLLIHYKIVPPSARQIQDEKKPKKGFGHFGEFAPVQSEKTSVNEGKK